MVPLQSIHPPGQKHPQRRHGEAIEHGIQKRADSLGIHRLTVQNHAADMEFPVQRGFQRLGLLALRLPAVDDHQIGLARSAHIRDGPLFRLDIVLPGNVRNGPVGGHHQA